MNDKIFKNVGIICGVAGTVLGGVASGIGIARTINGAADRETNAAIDAAVARRLGIEEVCVSEEI